SLPALLGPWRAILHWRIWASSSFLRHYDEAQILLKSQPQICAIGADGGQACKHLLPSPLQSMKPDASDNRAMPAPTSAWCPDAISRASSTGPAGSPNRAMAPYASCCT